MAFVPDGATEIVPGTLEPYLSLVVTARNDDHGGNLLGRMQTFVNCWLGQCRRFAISSELIVVEWNPPPDRPRLIDALKWPEDFGSCTVRFLEVPPELHRRYRHAEVLPLYQMIGKNAGIRRARGQFVLATNIDILFSSELAAFLAARQLQPGRMYRIDRHDAMSGAPVDAPPDEQLDYCRTHLIRVNTREGSFPASPDGKLILGAEDIASGDSGILFGHGWFPPERYSIQETFRWSQDRSEVLLEKPPKRAAALLIDLEPGPGTGGAPLELEVLSGDRNLLAHLLIERRSQLRLPLPVPAPQRLWFCARGAGATAGRDPRTLSMRAFRFAWELRREDTGRVRLDPATLDQRSRVQRLKSAWAALQLLIRKLAMDGPLVPLTVPVSPRLRRLLKGYVEWGGFTGMARHGVSYLLRASGLRTSPSRAGNNLPHGAEAAAASTAETAFLHTNACGDFTLMAREHWFDLRGYPEFDLFSMNLDSVFCFAAHYGGVREEMLDEPMRIYHIEHGSGSGWTPEGQAKLFERLAAKGLPFIDNEQVLMWAAHMRSLNMPMIFNHENWGLAEFDLKEVTPPDAAAAPATAQ